MTRLALSALLIALTASCTVMSLPPAASRADGGPVSSRGIVSHEARSQLRLYRDAAGCESIQTVNRQFRLVTVVTEKGAERRVLEESYDVRHCLQAESASSEAAIVAWRPDSTTTPLFRIAGRGTEGEPAGNLYRMTQRGCCGSQELATYFSLPEAERGCLFINTIAELAGRDPSFSPNAAYFISRLRAAFANALGHAAASGAMDARQASRRTAMLTASVLGVWLAVRADAAAAAATCRAIAREIASWSAPIRAQRQRPR